jgi:endonuclease/exonuclease/phosphatase family metal-dependent hydrolase
LKTLGTCSKAPPMRAEHDNWRLDDVDERRSSTGLRVMTHNFNRKLYSKEANVVEAMEKMLALGVDVLIGTEPGKASRYNVTRLKNVARGFGFDVKLTSRDGNYDKGGVVMIINRAWSSIPSVMREYKPEKLSLRGRLMSLEFNNKQNGQHNKIQIIGAHLVNSPHTAEKVGDSKRLLTWILEEKARFTGDNPQATLVLAGDFNAAESEYLDTDRDGTTHDSGKI